jgi:hypothetical protein
VNGPVVASFNVSNGSVNWTYQAAPQYSLSIIEATSGNGLVAKTTDQSGNDTPLIFDSSGNQTQPGLLRLFDSLRNKTRSNSSAVTSNLDYYSNGSWLELASGTPTSISLGLVQSAMSSYFQIKGGSAKQSSAAAVVANFETVDPTTPGSAAGFQSRYQATNNTNKVSINELTNASFAIYGEANWSNFLDQIYEPVTAVAFIGHSLQAQSGGAVGLCFGQQGTYQGYPLFSCYSPTAPSEYMTPLTNGAYYQVYPALSLPTQAKIIFFAACELGTTMENFMGITNSTVGRALLFPSSSTADIPLGMGEYEWLQIVANLTSSQNLQQAVANANTATAQIIWKNAQGQQVPAQAWQVIGDSGNGGTGIHF